MLDRNGLLNTLIEFAFCNVLVHTPLPKVFTVEEPSWVSHVTLSSLAEAYAHSSLPTVAVFPCLSTFKPPSGFMGRAPASEKAASP